MKNGVRTEPGVAALDGKVHVFGGSTRDKDGLASGEAYDPANNIWSDIAPMPVGVNHNAAVALNGHSGARAGLEVAVPPSRPQVRPI